ncbi:MAG: T9SS type A sorting domain-containing protein, partial [Bacteroidota bacterium]
DPRGLLAVGDDLYFGAAGVPNDRELYRIDAVSTTVEPVPSSASVTVSPNPFHVRTTLTLTLPVPSEVRLSVLDVLGREVAVLAEGRTRAGTHQVHVDGAGLATGVYVWRLARGEEVQTGRFTLVR